MSMQNFSLFLLPGGNFQLTPLYDIMTAYPLMAQRQLPLQKAKMAMELYGKNRHYHWQRIQPRHWISSAKKAKYSLKTTALCVNEMFGQMDQVIAEVSALLPGNFPGHVSESTFAGMIKIRDTHISASRML